MVSWYHVRKRKSHTKFKCGDRVIYGKRSFARVKSTRVSEDFKEWVTIAPTEHPEDRLEIRAENLRLYRPTLTRRDWPLYK